MADLKERGYTAFSKALSTYLLTRKVDAHSSFFQRLTWEFVSFARNTRDDDVAQGGTILDRPAFLLHDLMFPLTDPLAAGKFLHARDIDGVDTSPIVRKKCS